MDDTKTLPDHPTDKPRAITVRPFAPGDGAKIYRIARDTGVLDLNSSYSYLLWVRDFSQTSVVAELDGEVVGFITGYIRPDAPDTLMVWQVGVDEAARGLRVASQMLDALNESVQPKVLETTITSTNKASNALFASFAKRNNAGEEITPLFTPEMYPDDQPTEYLHHIAPLNS
ncbi:MULTISPECIES: diaminobutyrate acetyltransferase [Auritidibacter]|uniref:L-2,4-diaminobutyric acid acetyltransferase n=1 Tax=Auritidibacter ignavus TaxID=678932 RepID=A0AAJ6AN92_9MICC|nr:MULTISPECIES: diaminobutyrate acetyltransferase [Auritidibacter]PXA78468.1 diaminobutyrate acetyltransferase [Auritidibacter sp. NML120779]NIH71175.1 diaminobutyrate acetyltransferase [Auritidibacter ignavus]PXA78381.1 diaminobutyrate acetyltransferase [Auritidibacter sp. NML100628]PXA79443.1 diaminobutyrate acetyltransferase [Auritidibacter sp. NML120636]RMX22898.1 diaminobutyrate acetyltransferase [Auritidibacter ignavus]